ncbi:MAG TPA: DNA repair protein RecO [Thermoanaerobaculia bacterium]|nr:DNA repair protein RecO [Thermoanaerobaculia bacterium]
MRLHRTDAIVLHTFASRDRDKLVVFLTPLEGKVKGWAYGARSLKSRYGASLEPLAKVHIGYSERENEEVVRIESVDLLRSLFPAQQRLASSLAATYIAETVDTFAQPHDPSEVIFRLLDRAAEALLSECDPLAIVTYVEVWVLRIGGIFPSMRTCGFCQEPLDLPLRYEATASAFACKACADGKALLLANDVADEISAILRLPIDEFATRPHRLETLSELRSFVRDLRRSFLGHELKSHDLLQSVIARGESR